MKYLLSFLFVLVCFNLSAQSKWSLGLVGGIDMSNVARDRDIVLTGQNGESLDDVYKPSVQLRYGFNVSYDLSTKFTIKSGLRLNAQGTQSSINASDFRWGSQHDGQGGFDPTIDPMTSLGFETLRSKHRDKFIEVPLHIVYSRGNGQWSWFVEGGISPNVYITSTSVWRMDDEKPSRDSRRTPSPSFRKFTGSIDFGFGVEKALNDKISLSLQPMFRYYPLRISTAEEYLFKAHYYNFGIEFGASYALGK